MLLDPLVSNIQDSLRKTAVFLPFIKGGDFAQRLCSSHMKTLKVRHCSFQKLTEFTKLNKVKFPLAWNINASLIRAAVLLPFT
jgi:hypothetical protein